MRRTPLSITACLFLAALLLAGCARSREVALARVSAAGATLPAPALSPTPSPLPSATPTDPPTATPAPTDTPAPTLTPTATATSTVTPTPTAAPSTALLTGMNHQYQTYNNCGPASIAEVLGYYGVKVDQGDLNDQGFRARTSPARLAGQLSAATFGVQARAYALPPDDARTLSLVRYLLAERIPVIALQRLNFDERISHYRVIQGYDDRTREVIADDPYYGPGYRLSYGDFLALFPNTFPPASLMPVYRPDQAARVEKLMAEWGARPR